MAPTNQMHIAPVTNSRIHQIVSPISNSESTIFLTNIYYDFLFNWQTEKNSWKKFAKQMGEKFSLKTSDEFVTSRVKKIQLLHTFHGNHFLTFTYKKKSGSLHELNI